MSPRSAPISAIAALLLLREREGKGVAVALDQLAVAGEGRRARLLLEGAAALLEAELEREQLLERQPPAGGLGLGAVAGAVRRDEGVGAQRQALLLTQARGERVGEEADARERGFDVGAEPVRGHVLARAVLGDEADRVQARAAHLGARDAEAAAQLPRPVQEQLGARRRASPGTPG